MTSTGWEPAVTIDGKTSYQAGIHVDFGFQQPLARMGPAGATTLVLWHYPADQEFAHPESLDNYLQCAGTAECMTLELRVTHEDGSHTHWVLGRGPLTGGESERVVWDTGQAMVHPEEVWTAEQAAPLFEQYARERTVPDWVHRRELDI